MSLADAVTQRRLLHWHDRGFVRTVEPHLLCQLRGMRLVVIGLQVAGGPAGEPQQCWKVIDVGDGLNIDTSRTFTKTRAVPQHLLSLVHQTYASALHAEAPRTKLSPKEVQQQPSARLQAPAKLDANPLGTALFA